MEQTGYHVVLKPEPEGGYVAVVPAFPGCYSQGETTDEALPPKPNELSAGSDPLAWEGEGWS